MKTGLRTTEFFAVLIFGAVALMSGLDISDGVVSFHMNVDMMGDLKYLVLVYIGGRSAIKVAGVVKTPNETMVANAVAARIMEKAK